MVVNAEFLRFAAHWGFRARACRPYRAQTKGKVERPIRYVRENFVYGREFLGDAHLDAERARWLAETANVRIHATTKERPSERFAREEQQILLPLAERAYHSLVLLTPEPIPAPKAAPVADLAEPAEARVAVERRPLSTYARIAAGAA